MSRQANERTDNPEIDLTARGDVVGDKDVQIVEEAGTFLSRTESRGSHEARSPWAHSSQDTRLNPQRRSTHKTSRQEETGAAGPRRTTLAVFDGQHLCARTCHQGKSDGAHQDGAHGLPQTEQLALI